MSNIAISELDTEATNFTSDDLFLVSKKNGSSFTSAKMKGSVLKNSVVAQIISAIYPVGSIYTTIDSTFNPSTTFGGTWEQIASGKCLFGADTSHIAGSSIDAGLPKPTTINNLSVSEGGTHKHSIKCQNPLQAGETPSSVASGNQGDIYSFDTNGGIADGSHSHTISGSVSVSTDTIYGKSTTVQPPAIAVIFWKRTA